MEHLTCVHLVWETQMDITTTSQHLYFIIFEVARLILCSKLFKRCSNKTSERNWHTHQPLEGNAPGFGSRTKLAQVCPYWICSTWIRSIFPIGNPRALSSTQLSLAVDLLGVQNQKQLAAITAVEHPVLTAELTPKGLPVTDYYTRRLLNRINALPTGSVYHPVQIEAHHEVSHVKQLYLSTSTQ